MSETERVTLVGNLTADPELRYTPTGLEVASLRLAVTPRTRQDDGSWTQGETSFHTVTVWRDQATNAAETLTKGARVLVVGRPKQRTWTDSRRHRAPGHRGRRRGGRPSLRWATAKVTRTNGREGQRPVQRPAAVLAGPSPGEGREPCWASRTRPLPQHHPKEVASLFYTTPTDDGAIAVTCDRCLQSVGCPDPWAAAAAITHHHCDPNAAIAHPRRPVPRSTASSRRCTCWPAYGWPPARPAGSSSPAPEARPAASGAAGTRLPGLPRGRPDDQQSAPPRPTDGRPRRGVPPSR